MSSSSGVVEAVESWPVYLVWFIHHNSYYNLRFHELEALADLCGNVSKESLYAVEEDMKATPTHPPTALVESPWVYVRLPNDEVAKAIAERAVLVKAILSVWGTGKTIPETIEDVNKHMPREKRRQIITDELSFKYKLFAFGRKFTSRERQELMDSFGCLWDGDEKVDIENAKTVLWLISEYEHTSGPGGAGNKKASKIKRHFCAREVGPVGGSSVNAFCGYLGPKSSLEMGGLESVAQPSGRVAAGRYEDKQEPYFARYELTCRPVLGPTSLDNELAFIMANLAKIERGKIVYDCFVGTGGLALTASHFGAFVMGSDIDIRVLRGHRVAYANEGKSPLLDAVPGDSGPKDISIFRNFLCYGLARPEIIHADMAAPFWRKDAKADGFVDVILTDPPYGIRAGTKRVGAKTEHVIADRTTYVPQKVRYETNEVMDDLLQRAVHILVDNGMLVYLLPIELSQLFTPEELDVMEKSQEMAGDNPAERTRKRKRKQEAAARGKVAASTRVILRDETVMMSRAGQGPKGEASSEGDAQCVQYRDVYAPETARDLPFLTESNYLRLLPPCPKELEVVSVSLQILSAGLGRLVVSMRRLPR
ncbi:tRNA methyltransferase 11 [Perkinsus olseni]|uniref:tRNA (guanine(10)-N(2))-methyltransferase n=1 Tax=Perkinsus olseni TaxID=32597 RepID=A0A7J6U0W2_PEROL|nr:tRNA methyltransferase 11 [Perkinsus olseni]